MPARAVTILRRKHGDILYQREGFSKEQELAARARMGQVRLSLKLARVREAEQIVEGFMVEGDVVDKKGEVFDYEGSKPFIQAWSNWFKKITDGASLGNVRAMHGTIAAGRIVDLRFDDKLKRVWVAAKITDPVEWQKVLDKVYTGFSIGGDYVKKWWDAALEAVRFIADPFELSLADNPAQLNTVFTVIKADGQQVLERFRKTTDPATAGKEELHMARNKSKKKAKLLEAGSSPEAKRLEALRAFVIEHDLTEGLPDDPALWTGEQMLAAISEAVAPAAAEEEVPEAAPEVTPGEDAVAPEMLVTDEEEPDPDMTKARDDVQPADDSGDGSERPKDAGSQTGDADNVPVEKPKDSEAGMTKAEGEEDDEEDAELTKVDAPKGTPQDEGTGAAEKTTKGTPGKETLRGLQGDIQKVVRAELKGLTGGLHKAVAAAMEEAFQAGPVKDRLAGLVKEQVEGQVSGLEEKLTKTLAEHTELLEEIASQPEPRSHHKRVPQPGPGGELPTTDDLKKAVDEMEQGNMLTPEISAEVRKALAVRAMPRTEVTPR